MARVCAVRVGFTRIDLVSRSVIAFRLRRTNPSFWSYSDVRKPGGWSKTLDIDGEHSTCNDRSVVRARINRLVCLSGD